KALLFGARLARALGDEGAAVFYEQQAGLMRPEIEKHWDEAKGYIVATLDWEGGWNHKSSGLDVQVILASLYGDAEDGFFSPTDDRILSTAYHVHRRFKDLYPINRRPEIPGVAIGRYPEDVYYGGNPWVIATNGMAQLHYRAAERYLRSGGIQISARNLPFFQSLGPARPERLT